MALPFLHCPALHPVSRLAAEPGGPPFQRSPLSRYWPLQPGQRRALPGSVPARLMRVGSPVQRLQVCQPGLKGTGLAVMTPVELFLKRPGRTRLPRISQASRTSHFRPVYPCSRGRPARRSGLAAKKKRVCRPDPQRMFGPEPVLQVAPEARPARWSWRRLRWRPQARVCASSLLAVAAFHGKAAPLRPCPGVSRCALMLRNGLQRPHLPAQALSGPFQGAGGPRPWKRGAPPWPRRDQRQPDLYFLGEAWPPQPDQLSRSRRAPQLPVARRPEVGPGQRARPELWPGAVLGMAPSLLPQPGQCRRSRRDPYDLSGAMPPRRCASSERQRLKAKYPLPCLPGARWHRWSPRFRHVCPSPSRHPARLPPQSRRAGRPAEWLRSRLAGWRAHR